MTLLGSKWVWVVDFCFVFLLLLKFPMKLESSIMEFELIDLVFFADSILSLLEVWGVFGIVLGIEVAVKLP